VCLILFLFFRANVLYVRGRQYPVRINYTALPQQDPLDAALVSIMQIHREYPMASASTGGGDILVFLTGQEEIESCEKTLQEACRHLPPSTPGLCICPIFAALSFERQQLVFQPAPRGIDLSFVNDKGMRKVVLSTNIAETSITIPGISYVVDTGLVKQRNHQSKIGLDTLAVTPISQASCNQRSGRAGREGPGTCFRLFPESAFALLDKATQPEITRCNMSTVLLILHASGINDVLNFDYMDPPPRASLLSGLAHLYALGALDKSGEITTLGRDMARYPLEPAYARVLIASSGNNCTRQIARILACLSALESSLFVQRQDTRAQVEAVVKKYCNYDGDQLVMYNLVTAFVKETAAGDATPEQWCEENCVRLRSLKQVVLVERQILQLCVEAGLMASVDEGIEEGNEMRSTEKVIKTLLTGFFMNIATRQQDGSYKTLNNQVCV
jgi:HrpA-like RNA helicase